MEGYIIAASQSSKQKINTMLSTVKMFLTLSFPWPYLAMASYLIFPLLSSCTASALDVDFFCPIPRGNCATGTSGNAPPSPKSCHLKTETWYWIRNDNCNNLHIYFLIWKTVKGFLHSEVLNKHAFDRKSCKFRVF